MADPTWRIILNGKCAEDEPLRDAVDDLRARGVEIGVRVTWEPGDAARHVAEAIADRVDCVIAAGGDGTLGEVVAALAGEDAPASVLPALGVVPLGTANDFATAAGIPSGTAAEALDLVLRQPAAPVDVLRVEADGSLHWALNLASGGFGTEVTAETREGLKDVLGGLAYLVTGLSKLGRIEPIRARIEGPAFAWDGDFIALGIGNGRQAGGGQVLCPEALVDDGLLDLTIVPELEGELAGALGTVLSEGRQAALERIATTSRLPWVHVDAPVPLRLNLDGEPVEASRFRIECVGGRLRMHLPPDCPLRGMPGNPLPADALAGSAVAAGTDDAADAAPGLSPA